MDFVVFMKNDKVVVIFYFIYFVYLRLYFIYIISCGYKELFKYLYFVSMFIEFLLFICFSVVIE